MFRQRSSPSCAARRRIVRRLSAAASCSGMQTRSRPPCPRATSIPRLRPISKSIRRRLSRRTEGRALAGRKWQATTIRIRAGALNLQPPTRRWRMETARSGRLSAATPSPSGATNRADSRLSSSTEPFPRTVRAAKGTASSGACAPGPEGVPASAGPKQGPEARGWAAGKDKSRPVSSINCGIQHPR